MIPVNVPHLGGNERKYLLECVDTNWISSEGPFVQRFEAEFAEFCNRQHAITCANGSAALDIALHALRVEEGDEVILPAFTIISPAASVVRLGAKPVLVDSDPHTWQMNASEIEARITAKTKAIIVVHIYGYSADMDPILAVAEKHGLPVVEDAAEMHGQTYRGRPCGSFGALSTFSFYANKQITTGEGGMVVCDDDDLANRVRSARNLCFLPEKRFVHEELGWNYRMTNMQAALGLAQLERIEQIVKRKRDMGRLYNDLLADCPYLELPPASLDYADNIYWIYGFTLSDDFPHDAEWVQKRLGEHRIGTRPFFCPLHQQPVFRDRGWYLDERYPTAERLYQRGLYIPSGLGLLEDQQHTVAETLKKVLQNV